MAVCQKAAETSGTFNSRRPALRVIPPKLIHGPVAGGAPQVEGRGRQPTPALFPSMVHLSTSGHVEVAVAIISLFFQKSHATSGGVFPQIRLSRGPRTIRPTYRYRAPAPDTSPPPSPAPPCPAVRARPKPTQAELIRVFFSLFFSTTAITKLGIDQVNDPTRGKRNKAGDNPTFYSNHCITHPALPAIGVQLSQSADRRQNSGEPASKYCARGAAIHPSKKATDCTGYRSDPRGSNYLSTDSALNQT